MGRFTFRLPDIGEGIAEAEIVAWHVAVGDRVEEDQNIADMMTDKATVEKQFGRDCKSVLGRDCTAVEKGDYITFMAGQ